MDSAGCEREGDHGSRVPPGELLQRQGSHDPDKGPAEVMSR